MSNAIYLAASLPLLQFGEQPLFRLEDFLFRCQGVLSAEEYLNLKCVVNGEPGNHAFTVAFHACDTQIRNATAKARVAQWGGEARYTERMHAGFDVALSRRVAEAMAKSNPLEREEDLDRARWWAADQLAGYEGMSLATIYAFAVKLKINERYAALNDADGKLAIENVIQANDRAAAQ
jgi:hypothetical protein